MTDEPTETNAQALLLLLASPIASNWVGNYMVAPFGWFTRIFKFLGDLYVSVQKRKQERAYLATRISLELERFGVGCAAVMNDDGTRFGQPDERGCYSPQVDTPVLDYDKYPVEWQSIRPPLMYSVLSFPQEIDEARRDLEFLDEYEGPPHIEYMAERQYRYAKLGIRAFELAGMLKQAADLSPASHLEFDTVAHLKREVVKMEALRERIASRDVGVDL